MIPFTERLPPKSYNTAADIAALTSTNTTVQLFTNTHDICTWALVAESATAAETEDTVKVPRRINTGPLETYAPSTSQGRIRSRQKDEERGRLGNRREKRE